MNQKSFPLRTKFRICLLMSVAGFATLHAQRPVLADEVTVVGTNGNNGSDGVDGAPNGKNGGDGQSVTLTHSDPSGGFTNAIATGGNGGKGGNGFGDAGPGGNGGVGGNASVTASGSAASMKASATGGNGGPGGQSGVSSPRPTGFGGGGGSATATVIQTNGVLAEAIAKGGRGGVQRDTTTDGLATATVQSNSTVGSVEGRSTAIGGDGTADKLSSALGGSAIADLSLSGTTGATGYSSATAGNTGTVGGGFNGDERGNSAQASGLVITNTGLADLTVNATGGRGGDSLGASSAGTGGSGTATGEVRSLDQVRLNLTQTGGDGGNALGTGRGGNGADVNLHRFFEDIDSAAHTGEFHITSVGGNGGESNTASGQGGDVSSNLIGGEVSFATSLEIELNSIGGSGGFAHNGGVAQGAGSARNVLDSHNSTGGIESTSKATGGQGGTSDGGASRSGGRADARLEASGLGAKVSGSAYAYGGLGGGRQDLNGTAGNGGLAGSSGIVKGGNETTAYVEAVGGNGGSSANSNGGNGGEAFAEGGIDSSGESAKIEIHSIGGSGGFGGGTGNGGQAGNANSVVLNEPSFVIRSTNVSIGAYVTSGNGGGALGTGRGADGGSVNLNNATNIGSVQGSQTLEVTQSVTGGNGGFASDATAQAGKGGVANSYMSLSGSYSNSLTVATEAKGGRGGDNLKSTGGAGGNATSYSSATNTGNAIASAQSRAGSGGTGSGGISAPAGNATATAISRSDARAVAEASSIAKTANSEATTSGIDGYAKASSQTWSPSNIILATSAQASTGLQTHVATMASNEGAIFSHNLDDLAAYSAVWSEPTIDASNFFSAQDLNEVTTIALAPPANTQTLTTAEFGGSYSDSATPGLVQTQSIQTVLGFDGSSMLGKELFVGLHDGQLSGFTDATDSWSFTIQSQGSGFLQTWDSTGGLAFSDLFRDNLISLGLYNNLSWQDLVLSTSWSINGEDDSLAGKFFISSSVSAVPEPSMLIFGSLAATMYVGRKMRWRRKQRVNC